MNGAGIITFVIRLILVALGIYVIVTWYQMSLDSPERALKSSTIIMRAGILVGVIVLITLTSRIVDGDV
jgi:hypothetical protein